MAPTLLGVPFDGASSFQRGAAGGPAAIRQALRLPSTNVWSELGVDTSRPDVLTDAGDASLSAPPQASRDEITAAVSTLVRGSRLPIVLGGDHSITYPVLRAIRPHHPRLTILHLDAHPDLYEAFEGDRYSHACPFARIMEEGLADRLVSVGIRCANDHQRQQAERFGVETIDMRAWAAGVRPHVEGPLYLSIDLDVLDPAFAPGVSHPEPGGLTTRELLHLLHSLRATVVGGDVVELNPARDPAGLTALVAARIVKELAAVMTFRWEPNPAES